jgi:hypothetical protein
MRRSRSSPTRAPWLLSLLALVVCVPTAVQAIPATMSFNIDVMLADPDLPGGGGGGDGSPPGQPVQPVLNVLASDIKTTTARTLFGLTSVAAVINTGGSGLSTQGVAEVEGLYDPLRPPGTSPPGTLFDAGVFGHASLRLRFASDGSPLAVDLSGVLHRSGATWGGLASAFVELACNDDFPICMGHNFFLLPDGLPAGDYPFEFHTILPSLPPGAPTFSFGIGAEINLFGASGVNLNQETTTESRIVWNLQVRAVSLPPSLLLFGLGIVGLAVANWRRSS